MTRPQRQDVGTTTKNHDIPAQGQEMVVLVDESSSPVGQAPKLTVHTQNTPRHLAFSCHVYDERGRFLMTRRSLAKQTWPGVWTNAFCGHPAPGEVMHDAVRRRAAFELGLELTDIRDELPHFRYSATDSSGIVENEICPVFSAVITAEPRPRGDEVAEHVWVDPAQLRDAVTAAPWAFSPWLVDQIDQLARQERAPWT